VQTVVTTLLDTLGLLLVAAGATAGLYELIGWAALAAAGGVILAGSWLSSWLVTRR
jgi:hypothetical protein